MKQFTDTNFTDLTSTDKLTIIDFYAPWCGPCKTLGPTIKALSLEFEGKAVIGKCNVDNSPKTSAKFGIRSIPSIVFLKNGKEVHRVMGNQSIGALRSLIKEKI